jgi:hypothetical protein
MKAKLKATELIKISFEKIANASNYKGVQKDGGKSFGVIEDLSKKIAKDYIKIIVKEIDNFDRTDGFVQKQIDFWNDVVSEIDAL